MARFGKKLFGMVLAVGMLCGLLAGGTIPAGAVADGAEYAMFPMAVLYIVRTNVDLDPDQALRTDLLPGGGHVSGQCAFDLSGGGLDVRAPFTGTIVFVQSGGTHDVILQSDSKVRFANGEIDYMSCLFTHDDDIADLWVGKQIKQGDVFYQQGTYGDGHTGEFLRHLHIECARGQQNTRDKIRANDLQVHQALYLAKDTDRQKDYIRVDSQGGRMINLDWQVAPDAATPTIDRDTVLLLDYSGSMDGAPLTALKEAAVIFCEGVNAASGTNRVAIVIYDSSVRFQDFTQDLDQMRAYINNTRGGGQTNIAGALKKAGELMGASSAGVKNVLLMTDGMPNAGSYEAAGKYTSADHGSYRYANAAYNAAVELWDAKCNVYTLGFFHSLNATDAAFGRRFLSDMQKDGYWEVISLGEIEAAFKEILKEMQLDTGKWWEALPGWLQFILRYVFFGWLWMNWF
jgi:Mg-chelatase subunit ChlD